MFYRAIQPGKDRLNSAFYCGSPAVLRRKALEEVGGFAVESVTEDVLTSLRLHRRGWKSVYHNETLIYGVAPSTGGSYLRQRLRWGRGAMQVLRLDNPVFGPGLTVAQRLSYLGSLIHWFEGWRKLVYYVSPPVFLITGILPIRALDLPFLALWGAYHGSMAVAFYLASRGYASVARAEQFAMVRFATYIRATFTLLSRRPQEFAVTPKGRKEASPVWILAPQVGIACLNVAGLFRAVLVAQADGKWPLAYGINGVWAGVHIFLAVWAIHHLATRREQRVHYRLTANLPVWVGWQGRELTGLLLDCHEAGASVRLPHGVRVPGRSDEVRVRLADGWPCPNGQLRGRVVWVRPEPGGTLLASSTTTTWNACLRGSCRWCSSSPTGCSSRPGPRPLGLGSCRSGRCRRRRQVKKGEPSVWPSGTGGACGAWPGKDQGAGAFGLRRLCRKGPSSCCFPGEAPQARAHA